ncbi:O-acetyl-ADP-ribose deacetylase [Domibacillus sp. DTU_2020_1001157_1_SI_ALB_TIR_016]|uniref:O-acetyl-ADP-ribose deacetylase n=1 Tax=Domibacillus sp. DTU_2020_1001157_1_SI_ALB_TIR_016 TaxID=3077789 RepID=UPI0028E8018A|nr:O-acetyl-ADP-ribose deacetylase [Domibacillus sp. DTU_2020_1001157_1_SI_ALB_TIR_016]WNS80697.1 O-acetyl-ADP-ribose deacetylase [Domibacillus sp. DTU_2020_1001157_1_SI_ALB_TIR_016]
MKTQINDNVLELMVGDITEQTTEAIVNAANGSLLGGGGVDGAIHQAAGHALMDECKKIRTEQLNGEELATGEAVLTKGYELPAQYVIHTVGPVWGGGSEGEEEKLASCYQNTLMLAADNGIKSITFPSISTGVYGFPIEQAAVVALRTVIDFLEKQAFGYVAFTLFSDHDYRIYEAAMNRVMQEEGR